MTLTVQLLTDDLAAAWDGYVAGHPDASFFHLSAWRGVLADTFGHRPANLIALRDGAVCGVLPLYHVRSRLFGNRLASSPFCVAGYPLCDSEEAGMALDREAARLMSDLGASYIEYRDCDRERDGWVRRSDLYATFECDLVGDDGEQLKQIPRKQRAVLRKALAAEDLVATIDETPDDLFALYAPSVRNLGTPVFPKAYFERLQHAFGEACEILTIRVGEQPVASVLSFYFRDRVMPYYTGSAVEARRLGANDLMYWHVMRRAYERGARVFDFGRSKVGTGPYNFKKNWGFTARAITHQYCLKDGEALPNVNPTNPKYRLFIALWRRLPLPVANVLGPMLVKGTG